jgi:hypothetical protein
VHGPGAGAAARSSSPRGARTSIYRGGCSVARSVRARARAHVRDARVQAALADAQGVYVRAEHRQPVPGRANHVSRRLVGNRPRSRCSSAPREPGAGPRMIVYAELAGTAERLQRAVRGAAGTEALAERPLARVVRVRARRAGHRAPRRCRTRRARAAEPSRPVRARARSRVLSGPRRDGAHTRGRSRERPARPLRAFRQARARASAGACPCRPPRAPPARAHDRRAAKRGARPYGLSRARVSVDWCLRQPVLTGRLLLRLLARLLPPILCE